MTITAKSAAHAYAMRKLIVAVETLVGRGPQRKRLERAYLGGLVYLTSEDFPEELRPEFEALQEQIARAPDPGPLGAVHATLEKMDWREIEGMVKQIMKWFWTLREKDTQK